jgi:hypothetical protein
MSRGELVLGFTAVGFVCFVLFWLDQWPGALQPLALTEPDVNVSVHTAPTIRSVACVTTRQ